jgi:hypothetical protein
MSTEGSGGAVKDMGRVLLVRGEVVVRGSKRYAEGERHPPTYGAK